MGLNLMFFKWCNFLQAVGLASTVAPSCPADLQYTLVVATPDGALLERVFAEMSSGNIKAVIDRLVASYHHPNAPPSLLLTGAHALCNMPNIYYPRFNEYPVHAGGWLPRPRSGKRWPACLSGPTRGSAALLRRTQKR